MLHSSTAAIELLYYCKPIYKKRNQEPSIQKSQRECQSDMNYDCKLYLGKLHEIKVLLSPFSLSTQNQSVLWTFCKLPCYQGLVRTEVLLCQVQLPMGFDGFDQYLVKAAYVALTLRFPVPGQKRDCSKRLPVKAKFLG